MLNQEVHYQQEFATPAAKGPENVVTRRLDVLALARELKNVSQACKQAGISRSRFYEIKSAFDKDGLKGLTPQPRRKPRMPNQTPSELVEPILNMTARYPTYSYIRVSAKLRAIGCQVVPSTVRAVWKQQGLNSCLERLSWLQTRDGALPDRYMRRLRELSEPKPVSPRKPAGQEVIVSCSLISEPAAFQISAS
jgi:transposase